MPVKEPQFVDYLLSGLAGIGKGVVAGTAQRQERERQESIQAALEEYRSAALEQGRRQFQQTHAFNVANLWQQRSQYKSGQEFQKEMAKLNLEHKKEFAKYEKGLETGDGFLSKLLGGMTPRDLALMQKDVAQTRLYNAQAESKMLETQLERDKGTLPWKTFEYDKIKDGLDREMEWSKLNLNIQNQQAIAMFKAATDMLARRDFVPMHATMKMEYLHYLRYRAFVDPDATKEERQSAIKEYNSVGKSFSKWLDTNMGVKQDFGTLEWEDGWFRTFEMRQGISPSTEQPPVSLPPWPGPTGITPREGGGFDIQSGLPDFLQFFGQGQQQQAPPVTRTVVDITNMIQKFQQRKIKSLTQEHIDGLRQVGFDDEQIAQIQEGLE